MNQSQHRFMGWIGYFSFVIGAIIYTGIAISWSLSLCLAMFHAISVRYCQPLTRIWQWIRFTICQFYCSKKTKKIVHPLCELPFSHAGVVIAIHVNSIFGENKNLEVHLLSLSLHLLVVIITFFFYPFVTMISMYQANRAILQGQPLLLEEEEQKDNHVQDMDIPMNDLFSLHQLQQLQYEFQLTLSDVPIPLIQLILSYMAGSMIYQSIHHLQFETNGSTTLTVILSSVSEPQIIPNVPIDFVLQISNDDNNNISDIVKEEIENLQNLPLCYCC